MSRRLCQWAWLPLLFFSAACPVFAGDWKASLREAQAKVVKIYGAGGLRQLEAYQTGILISSQGHVLTAWSYVLDTEDLTVVSNDGRRWQAELVGSDPLLDLAVLQLPLDGEEVSFYDLQNYEKQQVFEGQRVLALANVFGIATGDEEVSVMQGVVTALAPLDARRGAYRSRYRGKVYVLDVSVNNPGAAGGALVDWNGRLLGVLGKELRSRTTGTWLNYALPMAGIQSAIKNMLSGDVRSKQTNASAVEAPLKAEDLGLVMIPDVLERTPSYIDSVRRNSSADLAGLRVNDLVVFVGDAPINSCRNLFEELLQHERDEEITISVLREAALLEFTLHADDSEVVEKATANTAQ